MTNSLIDSETLVVFDGGANSLAFNALAVRTMTAGELWTGDAPLQLGRLLGVGPGAFERRTRVLEIETSSDHVIPVLLRGELNIVSVPANDVQLADEEEMAEELTSYFDRVVAQNERRFLVVAPDALRRLVLNPRETPIPPIRRSWPVQTGK